MSVQGETNTCYLHDEAGCSARPSVGRERGASCGRTVERMLSLSKALKDPPHFGCETINCYLNADDSVFCYPPHGCWSLSQHALVKRQE